MTTVTPQATIAYANSATLTSGSITAADGDDIFLLVQAFGATVAGTVTSSNGSDTVSSWASADFAMQIYTVHCVGAGARTLTWTSSVKPAEGGYGVPVLASPGGFSLDVALSVKSNASGTSQPTNSITPTVNGDLIFAGLVGSNGSRTISAGPSNSFTALTQASGVTENPWAYLLQATAGAISTTWTLNSSDTGETGIIAFKPPSGATVPDAPTSVTATAGDGQASVSWTAPASNGGSAITDYAIRYSSNGGTSWTTFSHTASTATTQTVTGLSDGTAYIFQVAAVNAVGQGSWSSSSGSVTPTPTTVSSTESGTLSESSSGAGGSALSSTETGSFGDVSALQTTTGDTVTVSDITSNLSIDDGAAEINLTETSSLGNIPITGVESGSWGEISALSSTPASVETGTLVDVSSLTILSTSPSSTDTVTVTDSGVLSTSLAVGTSDSALWSELILLIEAAHAHQALGQVSISTNPGGVTIGVTQ